MKTLDNRDTVEVDDAKLLAELEELDGKEEEPKEEEEEDIDVETKEDEELDEKKEEVKVEPEKPKVDYEAKFKASTQEAMVMKAKLDAIEAEKNKPVEINEDYMKSHYPDWEDMTTTEQKLAQRTEEQDQRIKELTNKTNEYNNDKKWREQIDELVDDTDFIDANPKMKGKTEEFKRFCSKPTRKGTDMDVLTAAFLFEYKEEPKELKTLFKDTSGGHDKITPKVALTIEDTQALRKGSNKAFMDLIKNPKYDPLAGL